MEKLEKYADGENIFNRQMVARTVLETLRQVLEDKSAPSSLNASSESCGEVGTSDDSEVTPRPGAEVGRVFSVVELLARDTEATVRAELMEQVILLLFIVVVIVIIVAGASHRDVLSGAGDPGLPPVRPLRCCPHSPPAPCCQVGTSCEALINLISDIILDS